ncbi:hypothetical protein AMTR_s00180p00026970 [Amborella trichopoda]|uniref:Uncharacterized protein n=1 Tax=Amborella trichopoda TaxID=13333 RepID=W1PY22_AMBTC|nr:hypothetical protein AMTR_s00180p00026970 [Amborella trichopoda]
MVTLDINKGLQKRIYYLILVYYLVSDSSAVRGALSLDMGVRSALSFEIGREMEDDNNCLIASQALIEARPNRNSDALTKGGSISFKTMVRDAENSSLGSHPLPRTPMMVAS